MNNFGFMTNILSAAFILVVLGTFTYTQVAAPLMDADIVFNKDKNTIKVIQTASSEPVLVHGEEARVPAMLMAQLDK